MLQFKSKSDLISKSNNPEDVEMGGNYRVVVKTNSLEIV